MSTSRPVGAGRYAPSPSGDLHVGNLRTAVLAWLAARSTGRTFFLRIDDVDAERSRAEAARQQVADLEWLGLDWDAVVDPPSARSTDYESALASLTAEDLVYECYCSRKEIQSAPRAPHSPPGAYPGTCRHLDETERRERRAVMAPGRQPALRLMSGEPTVTVFDLLHGEYSAAVDDLVLRRGDGAWAYNLAVVVDDGEQGVDQVARGDDLLSSAPRQAFLADLLGYRRPQYAHVPLVLGPEGRRLAKRDGAVTAVELKDKGVTARRLLPVLAASCDVPAPDEVRTPADWLARMTAGDWSLETMGREPWILDPETLH